MALIKIFFKLLVLPLIAAVTLIQWVGIFLTQFSTVIFNLLLLLYPHFSVIILICEKRSAATGRGTESRKAQAMI